jgi:hypothetical protein
LAENPKKFSMAQLKLAANGQDIKSKAVRRDNFMHSPKGFTVRNKKSKEPSTSRSLVKTVSFLNGPSTTTSANGKSFNLKINLSSNNFNKSSLDSSSKKKP